MRTRTVDVNSLLQVANLIVGGLLIYLLFAGTSNEYVDQRTLALGVLLSLQTHVALLLERMRRDPFAVMFVFTTIFYCLLRIFTLALIPYSTVFDRFGFGPDNANYALVFILIANVFLYAGLLAVNLGDNKRIDGAGWRAASPRAVIILMITTFALSYFGGDYWSVDRMPRAVSVARVLLTPDIVVPMALAYYLLFRKTLRGGTALAIALLLVLEVTAHTLWGSRGAITVLVQTVLFVALAVSGSVKVAGKYVLLGALSLPILGVVMIAVFTISTYNRVSRQALGDSQALDIGLALQSAREGGSSLVENGVDVVLPPILARAGYFDFSAELIAHREEYRSIINLTSYTKSIIDNVLTPGFDLFDQPKISNALRFRYLDRGAPSKIAVDEAYHSDQLGIYGEFYALFGYGCLPLFFLLPYLLKRVYARLTAPNPFTLAMKRVVILYVFVKSIDSFGVDWTIGAVVPLVLGIALYSVFFSSRRIALAETEADPSPLARGLANA